VFFIRKEVEGKPPRGRNQLRGFFDRDFGLPEHLGNQIHHHLQAADSATFL